MSHAVDESSAQTIEPSAQTIEPSTQTIEPSYLDRVAQMASTAPDASVRYAASLLDDKPKDFVSCTLYPFGTVVVTTERDAGIHLPVSTQEKGRGTVVRRAGTTGEDGVWYDLVRFVDQPQARVLLRHIDDGVSDDMVEQAAMWVVDADASKLDYDAKKDSEVRADDNPASAPTEAPPSPTPSVVVHVVSESGDEEAGTPSRCEEGEEQTPSIGHHEAARPQCAIL